MNSKRQIFLPKTAVIPFKTGEEVEHFSVPLFSFLFLPFLKVIYFHNPFKTFIRNAPSLQGRPQLHSKVVQMYLPTHFSFICLDLSAAATKPAQKYEVISKVFSGIPYSPLAPSRLLVSEEHLCRTQASLQRKGCMLLPSCPRSK